MPTPKLLLSGLVDPVGLYFLPASKKIVIASGDGKLGTVDLSTPAFVEAATVPGRIIGLELSPDGTTAFAADTTSGVWEISLETGNAEQIVRGLASPIGLSYDATTSTLLVVEHGMPGRLYSLSLHPTSANLVARGFQQAHAVVRQPATGRMLVIEAQEGGRLVEANLDGPPTVLVSGLGSPVDLAWLANDQTRLLVADAAGGRVLLIDLTQLNKPPVELLTGLKDLWAARGTSDGNIVFGAADALFSVDVAIAPVDPVVMLIPPDQLFISGWVRVPTLVNDPALAFDDLDFQVEPAKSGATVSYSRDSSFNSTQPEFVLIAGWKTGPHTLIARHRPTGKEVGKAMFEVLEVWPNQMVGPALSVLGSIEAGPTGGTWGGPDSGDFTVPQNVDVQKAVGVRNIALVLVDTASDRYPTGAQLDTFLDSLRDEVFRGVSVGGVKRSVAQYYKEASNGAFHIHTAGIVGPINLPENWESYFNFDVPSGQWIAAEFFNTTVVSEIVAQNETGSLLLDLKSMDSLIFVVKSSIGVPPAVDRFVWPRATLERKSFLIGEITKPNPHVFPSGEMVIPVYRGIATLNMPNDWAMRDGTRQFHETLSHELGHNLGLVDQYSQKEFSANAKSRITGFNPAQSWELMTWERDLPLPSAAHRLMLGWLKPSQVKLYNFGVFGALDETITLHAASAGPVPASRFAAVEVRLEDGKNYYFEYRPATIGRIVDGTPPRANAVLGTEAEFRASISSKRPNILRVPEDSDMDQGAFDTGRDFREDDTSTPTFTNPFIVDVVSTTADAAKVRFRYAANNKPDPAMTPWSPSSNWQSPDIEVSNGRSVSDAAFRNVPWEGHDNTVVARVRNLGSSAARGVKVRFYHKDYTFGGGVEKFIGEQTQDIPVGATVTFTADRPWVPFAPKVPFGRIMYEQHSCVVARIEPFLDPVSNIWEVTPENNEAQSNYTWMATTIASPASRELTVVMAENPLNEPAVISFCVNQPHPLFRTYLDHSWVYLQPGEKKPILVMVESLYGDSRFDTETRPFPLSEQRVATTLRLSALADTHQSCTASVIGGVSIQVLTGIATRIDQFDVHPGFGEGRVIRVDTGAGVDGKVLISIIPNQAGPNRREIHVETQARNGRFIFEMEAIRDAMVQAHYLGRPPYAPSDSKTMKV